MARAAFYKGVRLWEVAQVTPGWAARGGSSEHEGVRQTYAHANPESPNFKRPIKVKCVVTPQTLPQTYAKRGDVVIENTLLDVEEDLIGVSTGLGHLSYSMDEEQRAAVTTGAASGNNRTVKMATRAAGWTLTTGQLVLFRKASTGAGFVTAIENVSGDDIVVDLAATIDSTWAGVHVQRAYVDVQFLGMDGGGPRDMESDPEIDRKEVTYEFVGYAGVLLPSATLLSRDAT